jgi:hypothetical protein
MGRAGVHRAGPASCLTDWLMPLAERRARGAPAGVLERLRSNLGGCAARSGCLLFVDQSAEQVAAMDWQPAWACCR